MSDTPTDPTTSPEVASEPRDGTSGETPPGPDAHATENPTALPGAPHADAAPTPGHEATPDPSDIGKPEEAPGPTESPPPAPGPAGPHPGQLCQGKVIRVTCEEVVVRLSDDREGAIPMIEFAGQPIPAEGDELSVIIERVDAATGQMTLSKRHADTMDFWASVRPGHVLEGVVTGMNRGGLDIDIGGARAFLPASQVDVRRMRDISVLIGEHVRCVVTQVDAAAQDLVVSRKKAVEHDRRQQRLEKLAALTEGDTVTGTVSNLTDYGAFVSIGGVEGLVHINDLSWSRIRHPSEAVQKGQEISVKILKVNRETQKVSLGLRQTRPDPWEGVAERYAEATRVKGKVLRLADFGAFLQLEEGVEALLPISELSWSRRINHPSEKLGVGDEIEVAVLKVDPGRRRISVGLKQTEENPWNNVEARFPVNEKFNGKVSKVADFGAFVELTPGVEGLIHISELADRRVAAVGDVVQEGQDVEVRVLKIDTESQRISLSMRSQRRPSRTAHAEATPDRPHKKRKRPLRGGLSSHFEW